MKHEQIEQMLLFIDVESDNVICTNRCDMKNQSVAFGLRTTPDPVLMNLLIAAPLLYQQLSAQSRALQSLIQLTKQMLRDKEDIDTLVMCFQELQQACMLAQHIARDGIGEESKIFHPVTEWS